MNQQLQDFARAKILEGLSKLPSDWQDKFKLMYGRAGGKRTVDDAKALPIADVVRDMSADKLDGALTQVDNSLAKLPPAPEPRSKLVSYAETCYPTPAAATGESNPMDEVVGWVCVHKDGGEPKLLGLEDRKIANQRMKLPNTWQLHPVTIRGAVQPSPAWCAALNKWALHQVRCAR
jgi:hypothetical protein